MELLDELKWFYQTRDNILALYGKECLQDNCAQQRKFFERLFDRARTLWELEDTDGSTMEMIVKTEIDTKLVRFQTYLYLTGIFGCLEDDATGAMIQLNREFNASVVFCDAAIDFAVKIANLQNWNGTFLLLLAHMQQIPYVGLKWSCIRQR